MSEWQRTVKTGRRDLSEPEVVETFLAAGAAVVKHSGRDEPDLFVGFLGHWRPVESKTGNGQLTEGQAKWWRDVAKQKPNIARNEAQANKLVRMWREEREREIAAAVDAQREESPLDTPASSLAKEHA